jgi:hypothetical protein
MSCYHVEVVAYGLDDEARDALFDRIADAAHDLDEEVTVGGGVPNEGECHCVTDAAAEVPA